MGDSEYASSRQLQVTGSFGKAPCGKGRRLVLVVVFFRWVGGRPWWRDESSDVSISGTKAYWSSAEV
jgi:hypothetical protein